MNRRSVELGVRPAVAQSTDLVDSVKASFDATMDNFRVNSESSLIGEHARARDEEYKNITGRNIYDDAEAFLPTVDGKKVAKLHFGMDGLQEATDKLLSQMQAEGRFGDKTLLNYDGIKKAAQDQAKSSLAKQQQVFAGGTKADQVIGGLAGGFGAMMFDPVNVGSMAFGAGAARSLLKTVFIEAATNAGAEAVSQPFIADWQRDIGNKYGFSDMAENVGMAALFGAAVPVAAKGISLTAHSGVEIFSTLKNKFKGAGAFEEAAAAEYMARKAHIDESATPHLNSEISYDNHRLALDEANASANGSRAFDNDKLRITEEQMSKMDPAKAEPHMRETVEKFVEKEIPQDAAVRIKDRGMTPTKEINPIFKDERPVPANIERQKAIEEVYSSPEAIKAEEVEFDALPDETPIDISFDENGQMQVGKTIGDYKKEIALDKEYINTIKVCGL